MAQAILRINSFDFRGSTCDGPGVRNVIFLQGCDKRCQGCHNPATWDLYGGKLMTVSEIIRLIEENTPMKKLLYQEENRCYSLKVFWNYQKIFMVWDIISQYIPVGHLVKFLLNF